MFYSTFQHYDFNLTAWHIGGGYFTSVVFFFSDPKDIIKLKDRIINKIINKQ